MRVRNGKIVTLYKRGDQKIDEEGNVIVNHYEKASKHVINAYLYPSKNDVLAKEYGRVVTCDMCMLTNDSIPNNFDIVVANDDTYEIVRTLHYREHKLCLLKEV